MASILQVAVKGERKTHIMYKCNLSHDQLQSYLALLLDKGLLGAQLREGGSNHTTVYVATDRGRAFMNAYDSLKGVAGGERFRVPNR